MKKLILTIILTIIPICAFGAVSKDENGIITYYLNEDYVYNSNSFVLPKITKQQAAEIAVTYVVANANDIIGNLDTATYSVSYSKNYPTGYIVRFPRKADSINYPSNDVTVWVDSQNGEVIRYNRNYDAALVFSSAQNIIDQKFAEQRFVENIRLELRYNTKIVDGSVQPYLVYVPASNSVLDANTGEKIDVENTYNRGRYFEVNAMLEKFSGEIPAELTEIITGSEAGKFVRDIPELAITDDYSVNEARYYKNKNNEYFIMLTYTNNAEQYISVTINAVTKRIVSYEKSAKASISNKIEQNNMNLTVQKYLDKFYAEYKLQLDKPQILLSTDSPDNFYTVIYERIESGIPYKSNGIEITLNADGNLQTMTCSWDNIEFPKADNVIAKADAYNIFFEKVGLKVAFYKKDSVNVVPVYQTNPMSAGIVDAITGEILAYDGKKQKERSGLNYLDIEAHYAKKQAQALADCDIFVSQGDVTLGDSILQKDFILLLSEISSYNKPIIDTFGAVTDEQLDMVYNSFVTNEIMDRAEVSPNSFVTRDQAVKYFIRAAGYKNIAELTGIYKNLFLDSNRISADLKGYVAIAYGLKLINGSDGYFNPKEHLTNGDSLIMLYNYMNRETDNL